METPTETPFEYVIRWPAWGPVPLYSFIVVTFKHDEKNYTHSYTFSYISPINVGLSWLKRASFCQTDLALVLQDPSLGRMNCHPRVSQVLYSFQSPTLTYIP